jgi:hypothetical protein
MKRKVILLTILFLVCFLFLFSPCQLYAQKDSGPQTTTAADCLEYEHPVQLTGKVVKKTFPGPPNYESVEKGDAPEVAWILNLDKSVCVKARAGDDFDVEVSHLRDLQLVLGNNNYYQRAKELLSRKIIVTGVLFGAHTGHHHTPVLMDVKNLQLLEDKY